jgi:Tol biopolymer transport system component
MVQGEWMYYCVSASDGRTRIYKMKTDGSNRTKLEQFDHVPGNMAYGSDGIYYLASPKGGNSSAIYRVRYDTAGLPQEYGGSNFSNSEIIVEIESSDRFAIFGDRLYYVTGDNVIYGIKSDGSGKKKIAYADLQTLGLFVPFYTLMCEVDEWLYVNITGKGTCRIKTDGSQKIELITPNLSAAVFNNELYFLTQGKTFKTDLNGKNQKVLQ